MKNFKKITLGLLTATILSLGLYACSDDNSSLTEKNTVVENNSVSEAQMTTNFKMKYGNFTYEVINENLFHIIDGSNGVHPVTYTSNTNLTLLEISDTEAILFEESLQKEYARLKIVDISGDLAYMDIVFHNGMVLNNIEVPKAVLGWGKWIPVIIEIIEGIFDYISGGDTALPEMVIYDMKDCYRNHMIAMQNCVGGSVSLIADQSTGQLYRKLCTLKHKLNMFS